MTTDPRSGDRPPSLLVAVWTLAAAGTVAWGVVAAVRQVVPQALVAVFLAAGLLATSLTLSADTALYDRIDVWRTVRAALLTGVVVVAAVGLSGSVGGAGLALLALVLVSSPGLPTRVREASRRWRHRHQEGREAPDDGAVAGLPAAVVGERDDAWERTVPGSLATEPQPQGARRRSPDVPLDAAPDWSTTLTVPSHLSDHDLCLAWESTGRALSRCSTASARLGVVRVRQACLDELERRQPDAVRAWLLGGADPDSSPARYLAG